MSEAVTLKADAREAGKGAARALRRTGRVPAVIYGAKGAPVAIHIEEKNLVKVLHTGHFMTTLFRIEHPGGVEQAIPRDLQLHVVSDRPVHVDFLRVSADTRVTVMVPVRFTDEEASPGIKRGATLNIVRHEIELECAADHIPEDIEISLAGRDVGESIHISAVTLPEGAKPVIDRDFTIATIAVPSALRSADDAAATTETPAA